MSGDNSDSKSPYRRNIRAMLRNPEASTEVDGADEGRLQFAPGWEEEFYRYKRSLKIPPKLISIGRPSWHRKSTSLPDLDPQHSSDASETFSEMNKRFTSAASTSATAQSEPDHSATPANMKSTASAACDSTSTGSQSKSIIDLLHQRVIRAPIACVVKSKKTRNPLQSEPKIVPQASEVELLPTPGSEGNAFKSENVFDSAVLTSRTRKEYKAMKRQEIIREVFGCEDRPASAPPLNVIEQSTQKHAPTTTNAAAADQLPDSKTLTFDQQYEQYLEKMNVDYSEQIRKAKKGGAASGPACLLVPKIERMDDDSSFNQDDESQDSELNECARAMNDIKEEACDSNDRGDTPSVMSDRISPTSFSGVLKAKKGRGNRYGRRKGSSGKL